MGSKQEPFSTDPQYQTKKEFLFDVLKRYDHYIATTNFKVALLMSFLVAVVFGLSSRFDTLNELSYSNPLAAAGIALASALTILSAIVSMYLLVQVVFPKTQSPFTGTSLVFYGDVANSYSKGADYFQKVLRASSEELVQDLANQTFILAQITDQKFKTLHSASDTIVRAVLPSFAVSLILTILFGR